MKNKVSYLISIPTIILILDQSVKFFIERNFPLHKPVEVVGNYLRITLVYNPGIAFGLNFGDNFPYTLITILITIFVIYLAIKEVSYLSFLAYCLIIGGALGNLFDRIFRGFVVDFIDVGINENLRWFVFNIADSVITIAIFLLIIDSFLKRRKEN
jgi:signal peptidase II